MLPEQLSLPSHELVVLLTSRTGLDRERTAPRERPSPPVRCRSMDQTQVLTYDDVDAAVEVAPATNIVVGHDGSPGAAEALDVALQLASDLGAPLTILRAWSLVTAPRPANWIFGYAPSVDELAEAVRAELVSDTQRQVAAFPAVAVTCRAYHAGPAASLIRASQEARMLVVGARGLGGLRELVLGSVSDQCVRHARCPVLVTRTHSD